MFSHVNERRDRELSRTAPSPSASRSMMFLAFVFSLAMSAVSTRVSASPVRVLLFETLSGQDTGAYASAWGGPDAYCQALTSNNLGFASLGCQTTWAMAATQARPCISTVPGQFGFSASTPVFARNTNSGNFVRVAPTWTNFLATGGDFSRSEMKELYTWTGITATGCGTSSSTCSWWTSASGSATGYFTILGHYHATFSSYGDTATCSSALKFVCGCRVTAPPTSPTPLPTATPTKLPSASSGSAFNVNSTSNAPSSATRPCISALALAVVVAVAALL